MRKGATALILTTLVLTGCTTIGEDQPRAAGSSVPVAATGAPTTPPPGALVIDEDTGETVSPRAVARWDEHARTAAETVAADVVDAFLNSRDEHWWDGLSPLLTQQAQLTYGTVDPAAIAPGKVTDVPQFVGEPRPTVARAEVPTTRGIYVVLLVRPDGDTPWLAARLTPPDDHNG